MGKIVNYTLFYSAEDEKLRVASCREEKEVLCDVRIGEVADVTGYEGHGNKLILKGLEFETTADIALVVPGGTEIVLAEGENLLKVDARGPEANVAALYSRGDLAISGSNGSLTCDTTSTSESNCLWSRGICVRYGDLTIAGGNIKAYCGTCSVHAGAVYAGGRLFGGDAQKGAITIVGGRVEASAAPHTIRATNTKLTIGAGSVIENSDGFSGSREEWRGDYLAQADPEQPIIIRF